MKHLFVILAALVPRVAAADLPKNMLEICKQREADTKKVEVSLKDNDLASNCAQQIRDSMALCMKDPGVKDEKQSTIASQGFSGVEADENGFGRIGMKKSRDEALAAYQSGQALYTKQADICQDERTKMTKVCDDARTSLKAALRQNSLSWKPVQDELPKSQSPATRNALMEQNRDFQQTSLKLQKQLTVTMQAQTNALQAMKNSGQCSRNQAMIYQDAADQTRTQAAAIAANGETENGGNAEKTEVGRVKTDPAPSANQTGGVNTASDANTAVDGQTPNAQTPDAAGPQAASVKGKTEPVDPKDKPDADKTLEELRAEQAVRDGELKDLKDGKKMVDDTLKLKAKSEINGGIVSSALKKVSPVAGVANSVNEGNYGDAAYTGAKWVAEKVFVPETAFRLNFTATLLYETLKPSPLGTCDTMYFDPVVAYQANCAVNTPMGHTANAQAITALSGD